MTNNDARGISAEERRLISLMERVASVKANVTTGAYHPVIRDPKDVYLPKHFLAGLEAAFGWHAANPNDSIKKRALELTFLPDEVTLRTFKSALLNPKISDIFVEGKRGAGKTIFVNYVLSLHNEFLQNQNITWFRADIKKLHEINLARCGTEGNYGRVSVHAYMALHAFFVVLTYANVDGVLRPLSQECPNVESGDYLLDSPFYKYLVEKAPRIADHWQEIRGNFVSALGRPNAHADDADVKSYIHECALSIEEADSTAIFKHMVRFLKEADPATDRKILLVIESVDNLRTHEIAPGLKRKSIGERSTRDWYRGYLEELNDYVTKEGRALHADKVVYLLRDDTVVDLDTLHQTIEYASVRDSAIHIPLRAVGIDKILDRKIAAITEDPSATKFGTHPTDDDSDKTPTSERLERFNLVRRLFFREHSELLSRSLKRHVSNDNDMVLDHVFNGSVRTLLRNLIRSQAYVDRYVSTLPIRGETKEDRLQILERYGRLIFEGSMLGGNLYFLENLNDRVKGRWCPTPVEHVDADNFDWKGLELFRVLQYFENRFENGRDVCAEHCIQECERIGYSSFDIEASITIAREFGLLRLGRPVVSRRGTSEPSIRNTLQPTAKARYLLYLLQNDAAALYLLATSTKMSELPGPYRPNEEMYKFVHGHTGDHRYFWTSAARTGLLYIRHVNSAHNRDMKNLASEIGQGNGDTSADELRDIFRPFNFDHVLEQFAFYLSIIHAGERAREHTLVTDWEALVGVR